MKRILWIMVLCLPLLGNSCKQDDKGVVGFDAGKKTVNIDKQMIQDCPELMQLKGRSEEEVVAFIQDVTTKYQQCRAWKAELNKIVKDAFNVEDTPK